MGAYQSSMPTEPNLASLFFICETVQDTYYHYIFIHSISLCSMYKGVLYIINTWFSYIYNHSVLSICINSKISIYTLRSLHCRHYNITYEIKKYHLTQSTMEKLNHNTLNVLCFLCQFSNINHTHHRRLQKWSTPVIFRHSTITKFPYILFIHTVFQVW